MGAENIDRRKRINRLKKYVLFLAMFLLMLPIVLCIFLTCRMGKMQKQLEELTQTVEVLSQMKTETVYVASGEGYTPSGAGGLTIEEDDLGDTDGGVLHKDGIRRVYLTFDDGPSSNTEEILEALEAYDVKATFFVLGEWAEKYPDVIKQMVVDGHDVANHSDTHPHTNELSYDEVKNEIISANNKIEKLTGKKNNLFRAPYGEYNDTVIQAATDLGYYTIQWNVDSLDWKNPGSEAIISRVTSKVLPGSIILLHNGTQDTAKVLPTLIQKLKADGYTFKPVSEFIYKENYIIDHTGRQIKK